VYLHGTEMNKVHGTTFTFCTLQSLSSSIYVRVIYKPPLTESVLKSRSKLKKREHRLSENGVGKGKRKGRKAHKTIAKLSRLLGAGEWNVCLVRSLDSGLHIRVLQQLG
jgi:hypothetical protein